MTMPRATERHPAGYPYRQRFPSLEVYHATEGGTVYVADEVDGHYALSDESMPVELLGEALDAITIHAFETREARDAYCASRYAPRTARTVEGAADAARPGPTANASRRVDITSKGASIRTIEDWFEHARPKGGRDHWVAGRSALECAASWCGGPAGPREPEELRRLLNSHEDTRGYRIVRATPEHRVRFDRLRGEPRNADLVAVAERGRGVLAISIEAKADEPFDRPVQEVVADAVDRVAHGDRSDAVTRVEQLAAALLPARRGREPRLGDLRYQLLTGVAGALAYATEVGAARAVFVVHEFFTAVTRDERHERNAADLDAFVRRLSDGAHPGVRPGRLIGPLPVPGAPLFDEPAALYIGKAVRHLR